MARQKRSQGKSKQAGLLLLVTLALVLVTGIVFLISRPDILYKIQSIFIRSDNAINWKSYKAGADLVSYDPAYESDWKEDQSLFLINKDHPIPDGFEADLAEYRESTVYMNRACLEAYGQLSDAVKRETGETLYISSLYRTHEEQAEVYANDPVYALPPGMTEHQTGLAIDVYVAQFAGLNFIECPAGQFVNSNCSEYGFIIRYAQGKEDITGIPFEPWHIRYVGLPHSIIMEMEWWTLEEYIDHLVPGEIYDLDHQGVHYLVSRQKIGEPVRLPKGLKQVTYSPDNTGYLIITATIPD